MLPVTNKYKFLLTKLIGKLKSQLLYFPWIMLKYIYYNMNGKNILSGSKVNIRGVNNIDTQDLLQIGIDSTGFAHKHDYTLLNIRGILCFRDKFSIGRGCRIDLGENAIASIGRGYINSFTTIIIMNELRIGDNCAISWNCQFLDHDFHDINYDGKNKKNSSITIGNDVWIGCNALILRGAYIPDGCVIAAGSVVSKKFDKKNCLIAGNPAKVVKEKVSWC